jgi:hypothetical protein
MKNQFVRIAVALALGFSLGMSAHYIPKSGIVPWLIAITGVFVWFVWLGKYLWQGWKRAGDVPNKPEYKVWLAVETCCIVGFLGSLVYAIELLYQRGHR